MYKLIQPLYHTKNQRELDIARGLKRNIEDRRGLGVKGLPSQVDLSN